LYGSDIRFGSVLDIRLNCRWTLSQKLTTDRVRPRLKDNRICTHSQIQEEVMKRDRILIGLVICLSLVLSVIVVAQVRRPYRNGSVWSISFIQMKPGMDTAYLNYISGDWKREQEALKKDGQIISYKVLQTEGHSPTDFNLMLMTEYKDMATMEANETKADNLLQTVIGNDEKQMQGYRDRLQIREVLGIRLAREIVLEPRP
jgi:hypothetical protein